MYNFILIRPNCLYYQGQRDTLNQALDEVKRQALQAQGSSYEYAKAFVSGMLADGSWYLREVDLVTFKMIV